MQIIAGIDEAGRGCLAGPVVAGAVILPKRFPKNLLQDSKILNENRRDEAFAWISAHCICSAGIASHEEIDDFGIKKATHLAMNRAIDGLRVIPELLMVDGCDHFAFSIASQEFIKGDARFPVISAASIYAKVTRDTMMREYDTLYPDFGFAAHKGYGVASHLSQLLRKKYSPIHRLSFAPLRNMLRAESGECETAKKRGRGVRASSFAC